ncbi:TetR family transcriptional regulator [Solwaraspora sp. WMMD1047]|uniref:TetR family transcriptional regulator n=1 Tax=Solwaraspora sp. WMMD1047 TaxID=3016102 RepID=UPI002417309A|nr:TetR family transcriptional regulator [Solwaraspora sp. WMMD1047]MDG4829760.1 TetR family transcriptional regulator [Solwaraspora sp. WMMD1047]
MQDSGLAAASNRPPDTRARILETAMDLFARHGYQRTPLRVIADQLGLTKAAILYHFPTKEALLTALVEPFLDELDTMLDAARALPPQAARSAVLEGFLDVVLRHRRALGMLAHDMSLLARGESYQRLFGLSMRMNQVVAGPRPSRRDRVRSVQAFAMLSDPVVMLADIPDDLLRADMLDGLRRLLPDLPLGDPDRTGPAPARSGPERPDSGSDRTGRGPRRSAGRPRALSEERIQVARRMHASGAHTVEEIAGRLGVSRATVYRHLAAGTGDPPPGGIDP